MILLRHEGIMVATLPEQTELPTQAVNTVDYRRVTLSQRTRLVFGRKTASMYLQG